MKTSDRFPIYRQLLKLYPPAFREKYTSEVLQTLADMLDGQTSRSAKASVWLRTAIDFPISLLRESVTDFEDVLVHETPSYVKASGAIAGLLLVPFFLALIANGLDKIFYDHTLYQSWLWSARLLKIWVLTMPEIALAVALATFAIYVTQQSITKGKAWWKNILDVRHNWPVTGAAATAVGILFIVLFHDSVHCFIQNPFTLITHVHNALVCARNS